LNLPKIGIDGKSPHMPKFGFGGKGDVDVDVDTKVKAPKSDIDVNTKMKAPGPLFRCPVVPWSQD